MGGEIIGGHGTPAAEDVGLARGRTREQELFDGARAPNCSALLLARGPGTEHPVCPPPAASFGFANRSQTCGGPASRGPCSLPPVAEGVAFRQSST